jgi:hypothetical protein
MKHDGWKKEFTGEQKPPNIPLNIPLANPKLKPCVNALIILL